MPLTAGRRDEQNQRINNIILRLHGLGFVPEKFGLIDEELSGIELSAEKIESLSASEIIKTLQKQQFDWIHFESFADWISSVQKEKAIMIYEFIQRESQQFSFGIRNKNSCAEAMKESYQNWKTDRLTDIEPEEFYDLIQRNRQHIEKTFPGTLERSKTLEDTIQFLFENVQKEESGDGYYFYLRDTKTKMLMGYVLVKNVVRNIRKCELAYFIDRNFEGKGIISKAVSNLLDFCFNELKMNKITICTSPENAGSQRIATKHGFQKEGFLREEFKNGDRNLEDILYFGLLKSDYHER